MVLLLCVCGPGKAGTANVPGLTEPRPFVDDADYARDVPTPESIVGHAIGAKAVRYGTLAGYLYALAQASDRVTLTSYGQSHEGRRLYYLTITSRANHERLDRIRSDNAKLADPRKLKGTAQADQIIKDHPAVAWLNYSIHGDELSSTDAALFVAYHLTASRDEATRKLLDETVIHIDPLVNPDGRERYLSHLQQLTGVVSSPDLQSMQHQALWSRGRGNHYLFDLNRDWLIHRQPEVASLAKVILSWNPHLLIDSHEQNAYDTYLFDPPREPINTHLSPAILNWRTRFSVDQAKAFNRYGWSYYTKDWYSEWSPIYTNAWASLQGSIALLYEQARVDAASVKHATGEVMTFRQSVHHHIVSSLANLKTLQAHRREILNDFVTDRQQSISEDGDGDNTLLVRPCSDTARWNDFLRLLEDQGIEMEFAQRAFHVENATGIGNDTVTMRAFPEGTLVIQANQPRRRILRALCDLDPHLKDSFLLEERKEIENRRESLLYDVTSWNLPMAFALDALWVPGAPDVKLGKDTSTPTENCTRTVKKSRYGYLIDCRSSDVYRLLVRLFENQCHPRVALKPFHTSDAEFAPGTVLLRGHENPDAMPDILRRASSNLAVNIHSVDSALVNEGPDLGSGKFELLTAPRVAIASQWPVRTTSFGSVWYLLDHHLQLRSSPINIQNLSRIDLRKYNVLVLPDASGLERVLGESAVAKVRRWVEGGGTLVALGNSASFATAKDRRLSSVRLKRDVLDKLEEYDEAVAREKSARDIEIDPNLVWGTKAAKEPNARDPNRPQSAKKKDDIDALKRADEWQRLFGPRGSFLLGLLETEHWLSFGLSDKLPVMFSGSGAFMSKYPVATPVRLADPNALRLSGLLWPEARQRLANTAYATVEAKGRGQIILFATDPTSRMWFPGMQRLFLNAVLLGPGMGTSQPLPW